ncbi:cellulase family glycosylhydrolase [Ventrimonas sp. CLA-AP-H27]|uniref:Cellulase family glycosylhydrolase n=1 Tax=Ventrimonas faecis TaxID=3133170 RepID=A0ABV1HPT5_9FIRM
MRKQLCLMGLLLCGIQMTAAMPAYAGQWKSDAAGWWYEQDDQSCIRNGWLEDTDGRWYYFGADGYMEANTMTPDGYVVGADGAYIPGIGFNQDEAVSPWTYQSMLGRGMDVTWSEFRKQTETYSEQMVKDFKQAGVDHVRIRVKDEANDALFQNLDRQILDCLNNGVIPVLAYQAHEFKVNPTEQTMTDVTAWWRTVAEHYRNVSHLLSFDLMIESSDAVNKQPETLNQLYEQTVSAIRETNPDRIIIISPRLRSDPTYLHELRIPSSHNGYLMAEWHFYASGPDKTNDKKKWTTGTDFEKKLITDKINLALAWQNQTGVPTWVGAWMPGNYNKGDDYSIEEQVAFSSFMTSALTSARIPFAVNSDTKFYDAANNTWLAHMQPVVQTIYQQGL